MPRKKKSKSAPKSSSSSSNRGLKSDDHSIENNEGEERRTRATKSRRSLFDDEDEELKIKPPKSKRSIIKTDRRYDGDPSDTNDDYGEANGESDKKETTLSEKGKKDDPTKQRSWFWTRKESGDNVDDDDEGKGKGKGKGKKKNKKKNSDAASELDAMSNADQSIQTKMTQANRHTRTVEDCETEYHEAIRDHNWDCLDGLLKEYDPMLYKKSPKAPKVQAKKNIKLLKYMPDMSKFKKGKEEPEIPISPLLALDKDGRTPLHLCCIELTPPKLVLRCLNCERNAAAVKDKQGNLPLHLAIQNKRKLMVVERLVRGYYQGSWTGDGQNRTPLIMAIGNVIQKQQQENSNPTKTYWGFPASPEDLKWQKRQEKLWNIPEFLLQNRMDRRKRLLSLEHNQIFVALNICAPPKIIANMLATGRKYLITEEVAGKVIFLLISRQYPFYLFKWFLEVVSVAFIKDQHDFTGCGVVAAHFRVGCIKHIDQTTKLERDSFAITMKRLAFARKNGKEFILPPQYTEWWEKLTFFINLWVTDFWDDGDDGDDGDEICHDEFLLHNALRNRDAPPLLIQLLAKLYPKSILISHPKSSALPIHFACRQWRFREYPPRRGEKIVNLDQISAGFLKEDLTQTRKRHNGRLPLHHAIATGKTWDFVEPLVTHDPKSLLDRDPTTCFLPFQMAARKIHETFDVEVVARREYSPTIWNTMSCDEQERQMSKLLYHYDLKQLDLIYELLRHSPVEVTTMLLPKEKLSSTAKMENETFNQPLAYENLVIIIKTKLARSLFGLGNVEGHYIGWCYEGDSKEVWKAHRKNFSMVKMAISNGFVPKNMDKWWRKLQFWLWKDCIWDNIPRRADFLLHCALCNPNVSPWIVELILECFPRSATIPLPDSGGCYPLHIACVTDTYIPMAFEFSNKRNVIEMVSKAFHESILLKWNNMLPLHYAILRSKQWSEMRSMAEDEPVSLAIPDSENDFFPFQLMALHKLYTKSEIQRFVNIAMTTIGKNLWEKTSANERVELLKQVLLKHETDSLGCIFELLKRNPMLVHVGTVESKDRRYHKGDGVGSANNSANKISIQQYLNMLEPNLPSPDIEPLPDFDGESTLLQSWVF